LQLDALEAAGCLKVYKDTATGTKADRPQWNLCLADLRPGDTLVIWKIDRLGRNLRDLIDIVTTLDARGVGVQSLTNGIVDTTTSHGKLVFGMFALMAEYEAALIKERTQAGLIAARARGRTGGRKSEMTPALIGKAQRMCANGQNVDSSSSRRMGRNPIRRRHSHIHRALRTHKRVPRVRLHLAIPAASATSPSDRRMEFAEPRRPQDCATASDGSPCRRSGSAQQRASSSAHPGRGNDLRFSITEVLNRPRGQQFRSPARHGVGCSAARKSPASMPSSVPPLGSQSQ